MKAQLYQEECANCMWPIEIGAEIVKCDGGWRHKRCESEEIGVSRYEDEDWGIDRET